MCLLIALFGTVPGVPLLIAANRDELYQRPADPITVLRPTQPRILGGRDGLAGGTWLAVNEHGVVAGLTNQPSAARDPAKRSRGELPLAFTRYPDARTAVTEVCARLDPSAYNPCAMLVGDRHALFSVDLSGGHRARVEELPPGNYVLENAPLRQPSAKQQRVAGLVSALADGAPGDRAAEAGLAGVLRDHQPAAGPQPAGTRPPGPARRTVGRLRAHGALWHPVGHDRQRGPGGRAPGERGRGPAVRDTPAGRDRDVGLASWPPRRRFAVIASIASMLSRGRRG